MTMKEIVSHVNLMSHKIMIKFSLMRLVIFLFIVMIVQSCSNGSQQKEPFKSMLAACDDVNINFYNGGDSVKFDTQDSLGIKVLTQSINGSTEPINDGCKPSGAVYYRAKG